MESQMQLEMNQLSISETGTDNGNEKPVEKPIEESVEKKEEKSFGIKNFVEKKYQDLTKGKPVSQTNNEVQNEVKEETENQVQTEEEPQPKEEQGLEDEKKPESTDELETINRMNKSDVVKLARKFQSNYDKTKAELDKLKSQYQVLEEQLNYIYSDPINAIQKIAPDIGSLIQVDDVEKTVKAWQQNTLLKQMKEKFGDKITDDWEPDPSELTDPESPTFYYTLQSQEMYRQLNERKINREKIRQMEIQKQQQLEQIANERNMQDLMYLKNEFGLTDQELQNYAERYAKLMTKLNEDPYPDFHPQRVKNLILSTFFDEFVNRKVQLEVEKAINQVHSEYQKKGIYIKKPDVPIDATESKPKEVGIPKNKSYSPLNNLVNKITNINK